MSEARHLVAVDAGNTNVVFGVFDLADGELVARVRLVTIRDRTSDEYAALLEQRLAQLGVVPETVVDVVIGSVVPPLDPVLSEVSRQVFGHEPITVGPGLRSGLPLRVDNPAEVGADRILNSLAVRELFGAPAVVVDFGTATTFDVVSAAGEYVGGVIAPGIGISAEALFERAARLPRVEARPPGRVIGHNTVESMQSGLFYGYVGLIEGILGRIRAELGGDPRVVATGGLAETFQKEAKLFSVVEPDLTLHGLRLVHERSRRSGSARRGA